MFLLLHAFTGKLERGVDLGAGQRILTLPFFKAHTACKAADNQRNWYPRAANDRLSVADLRVNDDLLAYQLRPTNRFDFGQR